MANGFDPRMNARQGAAAGRVADQVDLGLRSYMLSVYNFMASGVLLTGVVAMLFAQSGYAATILAGPGILNM